MVKVLGIWAAELTTRTPTPTISLTPSLTPSITMSLSITPTLTLSMTPTLTVTPSAYSSWIPENLSSSLRIFGVAGADLSLPNSLANYNYVAAVYGGSPTSQIYGSVDGINWTPSDVALPSTFDWVENINTSSGQLYLVSSGSAWNDMEYIATGYNNTNGKPYFLWSEFTGINGDISWNNGIELNTFYADWTPTIDFANDGNGSAVITNSAGYVLYGSGEFRYVDSDDIVFPSGIGAGVPYGVAVSPSGWDAPGDQLAVITAGAAILGSYDLTQYSSSSDWIELQSGEPPGHDYSLACFGGSGHATLVVAVQNYGFTWTTSPGGPWTNVPISGFTNIASLVWDSVLGEFIATPTNSSNMMLQSIDGNTWFTRISPNGSNVFSLGDGPNGPIAAGFAGSIQRYFNFSPSPSATPTPTPTLTHTPS